MTAPPYDDGGGTEWHADRPSWTAAEANLTPYAGQAAVYFRFALRTDGLMSPCDGMYIDNVVITR
jgi:hypothetical protein